MSTWRRLGTLTNSDFEECFVWIFEYRKAPQASNDFDTMLNGEKLQEWAMPAPGHSNLEDDGTAYLVRSRFQLADGSVHFGFCSPCDDSGLDYVQPVLICPEGHIRFWHDFFPGPSEPEETCRKLRRPLSDILPTLCEALIPCEGRRYSETIQAIYVPDSEYTSDGI